MSVDCISHYDYELPSELIASVPLPVRDASRLLTLDRQAGTIEHRQFREFPQLLHQDDLLVLNQTRVVPARLTGVRTTTGGRWEGLFLGCERDGNWRLIGHTRGKLRAGESITLTPPAANGDIDQVERLQLHLIAKSDDGEWTARPDMTGSAFELLDRFGAVPLPPYIDREMPDEVDRERYQTTYARTPGAIAAPTAGLHFTPEILQQCQAAGVRAAFVTLHVGQGTFRPVTAEKLEDHTMHREWCELPATTVEAINQTVAAGGRVVAVGTTTVRTLESVAARGPLQAWTGETDLFIRPPYEFRIVDALLTNFHLPRSTLLVLASAFAGRDAVLNAYASAVEQRYRFFSYGDAMFIA